MPDLSSGYDLPNPYGLGASVFDFDMDSYSAALKFLSDLAGGTVESDALKINGGDPALLVSWKRSDKFRRVYAKCRAAGDAEREALTRAESASAATEGEGAGEPSGQPFATQRFVPLEDVPVNRSPFSMQPIGESWGEA